MDIVVLGNRLVFGSSSSWIHIAPSRSWPKPNRNFYSSNSHRGNLLFTCWLFQCQLDFPSIHCSHCYSKHCCCCISYSTARPNGSSLYSSNPRQKPILNPKRGLWWAIALCHCCRWLRVCHYIDFHLPYASKWRNFYSPLDCLNFQWP